MDFDPTYGEKLVFELLRQTNEDCFLWYEIVLQERDLKPDFMLLDPKRGICIIEVKDWSVDAIVPPVGKKFFTIQWQKNPPHKRPNPSVKCKNYVRYAKEKLSISEKLTNDFGQLAFPVEYLIAFPNLKSHEFDQLELNEVIDKSRVLFREDLNIRNFTERFTMLLPSLNTPLVIDYVKDIRACLREEVEVATPVQSITTGMTRQTKSIVVDDDTIFNFVIDSEQEKIVKDLGEGPRLLRGLAGSGKTLVLLFRAKLKASNAEQLNKPQKILVVCWNITLANYMRQAFQHIKIPFQGKISDKPIPRSNKPSIEIVHFVGWTRAMFDRYSSVLRLPPTEQDDFLDVLTSQLTQLSLTDLAKYDAIYVDEAQDFREEWVKYLFDNALLGDNAKSKNFIIAADDAQRIYHHRGRKDFSWANLEIPMQGRSRVLRRVYRNSARVWMFAGFFLGNIGDYYREEDGKPNSSLWFAPKHGHDPELLQCPTVIEQIEEAVKTVRDITQKGYSARNVLILYPQKKHLGINVPELLQKRLKQEQIDCTWITESNYTKSNFNWSQDSVKISTVHSAKGMDAPVVIILCADKFEDMDEQTDSRKLMYVALTRAREYIKVLYTKETKITLELEAAHKEYMKRYSLIMQLEASSAQQIVI